MHVKRFRPAVGLASDAFPQLAPESTDVWIAGDELEILEELTDIGFSLGGASYLFGVNVCILEALIDTARTLVKSRWSPLAGIVGRHSAIRIIYLMERVRLRFFNFPPEFLGPCQLHDIIRWGLRDSGLQR